MIMDELLKIVNLVRSHKGYASFLELKPEMRLREDVGFESLDLAELTVRIEEKFDVDVFAEGLVFTLGEILARISAAKSRDNG